MMPAELLRDVRAGKFAPIYVLTGDERLTLEEAMTAIQSAVLAGGLADFNFDRFRGKETDAGRLETALGTSPMMAPRRLVLVREFDQLSEPARDVVLAFTKSPAPKTVLLLTAEKPDARTTLVKALAKHVMVKFETPYERELVPWCQHRAESMGVTLDDGGSRRLVEIVGRDVAGLQNALERLALVVGQGGRIRAETVESAIVETREQSVFELCDAVGMGEATRAWALARKMLSQREPPLRLLAMLSRHYRQLLRLREAKEAGIPREAAAATARVSPYALKGLWPQTEKHTMAGLRRALSLCFEADRSLKSSPLPGDLQLERLVVALCRLTVRRTAPTR